MTITMPEIRSQYPAAQSHRDAVGGHGYCVGGAICCFINQLAASVVNIRLRFPDVYTLERYLDDLRPFLPYNSRHVAAKQIIACNDAGDIEGAWQVVDQFLQIPTDV
jgi:hypothetical protein